MKTIKKFYLATYLIAAILFSASTTQAKQQITDTIYAGNVLPNASLIKDAKCQYVMLINDHHTYRSIKYLARSVKLSEGRLTVVQKLYNGTYTNADSVIVNRNTLVPVESYSDINTSKDSFSYVGKQIKGIMLQKEGPQKGATIKIDTSFSMILFNGLIYAETFQALTYDNHSPFVIEDYVPGHQVKFTRARYLRDDNLVLAGVSIKTKVIETTIGSNLVHYWLNSTTQELLKIEGKFPTFDYLLVRTL